MEKRFNKGSASDRSSKNDSPIRPKIGLFGAGFQVATFVLFNSRLLFYRL
jgi:hypothetical protein